MMLRMGQYTKSNGVLEYRGMRLALRITGYVFASERSERGNLQSLLRHPLRKYSGFLAMTSNALNVQNDPLYDISECEKNVRTYKIIVTK